MEMTRTNPAKQSVRSPPLKHAHAENSFNKYVKSLDGNQPNTQVLEQLTELQTLFRDIKDKENAKMDDIEKKIHEEAEEIKTITRRIQSMRVNPEKETNDARQDFTVKYFKFSTNERRDLCEALKSASKPCDILKDCYTVCEKMHKEALSHLSKAQLVEQQPVRGDVTELSQIQRQFCKDTSKALLKKVASNDKTSSSAFSSTYFKLQQVCDKQILDNYYLKTFELCWIMQTYSPPYKFCYDKFIREDTEDDINMPEGIEAPKKKKKIRLFRPKSTILSDQLELKYPAVVQGTAKVARGLRQKKVFY